MLVGNIHYIAAICWPGSPFDFLGAMTAAALIKFPVESHEFWNNPPLGVHISFSEVRRYKMLRSLNLFIQIQAPAFCTL
jgi:hypothetical protein